MLLLKMKKNDLNYVFLLLFLILEFKCKFKTKKKNKKLYIINGLHFLCF